MKSLFLLMMITIILDGAWAQHSALPQKAPVPKDNPQTQEKIDLGRQLYFDPRLSSDGTVSCNSCHNVMNGGSDNRRFSAGVKGHRGGRSAGTVFNAAFYSTQFWDGRAASLEEQAKGPLINPVEMGNKDHQQVIQRIRKIPGYVTSFQKAFQGKGKKAVNIDNLAKAIAAYERTLITPNSPFDRFKRGDQKAMGPLAQKGYQTFNQVGCVACHSGPNFSGPTLPQGTGFFYEVSHLSQDPI